MLFRVSSLSTGITQFNIGKTSTPRNQELVGISMEIRKQFVLIRQKEEYTFTFLPRTMCTDLYFILTLSPMYFVIMKYYSIDLSHHWHYTHTTGGKKKKNRSMLHSPIRYMCAREWKNETCECSSTWFWAYKENLLEMKYKIMHTTSLPM